MMRTVKEIVVEVLLEETPLAEEKCKQIAEKITKKLGMEKTEIIEGAEFKPSQTLLASLFDTIDAMSNNSFAIGEVEEEQ